MSRKGSGGREGNQRWETRQKSDLGVGQARAGEGLEGEDGKQE